MNRPRLEADVWLSEKLGKPAFHVVNGAGGFTQAAEFLRPQLRGVLFADAKIAADDAAAAAIAQELGFSLVDTNLRFGLDRKNAPKWKESGDVGFATPDMADAVGLIAAQNFRYDRFHRDPKIGQKTADAIKRDWAHNFFSGKRGDWMVVAKQGGKPAGFLQLLRGRAGELIIDLIAVAAPHHRKGLAHEMITFATARCDAGGPIVVGTQASNIPSVRLYESMGFRLEAVQYVFHHHGTMP